MALPCSDVGAPTHASGGLPSANPNAPRPGAPTAGTVESDSNRRIPEVASSEAVLTHPWTRHPSRARQRRHPRQAWQPPPQKHVIQPINFALQSSHIMCYSTTVKSMQNTFVMRITYSHIPMVQNMKKKIGASLMNALIHQ